MDALYLAAGAYVINDYLRGLVTFTPFAERLAVEHYMFNGLRSVATHLPLAGRKLILTAPRPRLIDIRNVIYMQIPILKCLDHAYWFLRISVL